VVKKILEWFASLKKIQVFGLGVAIGVLVASIILFIWAANQSTIVDNVTGQLDKAQNDERQLAKQLEDLQSRLDDSRRYNSELTSQLAGESKTVDELRQSIANQQKDYTRLVNQFGQFKSGLASLETTTTASGSLLDASLAIVRQLQTNGGK
jgi:septal ring factor EnvC (AmiA/AmiB activator)